MNPPSISLSGPRSFTALNEPLRGEQRRGKKRRGKERESTGDEEERKGVETEDGKESKKGKRRAKQRGK